MAKIVKLWKFMCEFSFALERPRTSSILQCKSWWDYFLPTWSLTPTAHASVCAPNLYLHKYPDNTISTINNDNKNTSPTSGPVRNHNLKAFQRLSTMKINQCWQPQPNQGSWRQFPALLESCQPNPLAVNTVLRAPLTRENEQITWGGNKLELHHVMNGGVEGRNQPPFVLPNYLLCTSLLSKSSGKRSYPSHMTTALLWK